MMYIIAKFKLRDESMMDDWKKLSAGIQGHIADADGFISRDSAVSENGDVYCIVKWESAEKQATFHDELMKTAAENPAFAEFERIVDMESMTKDKLSVI